MLRSLLRNITTAWRRPPRAAGPGTVEHAAAAHRQMRLDEAASLYREHLHLHPDDDLAWHAWAGVLRQQGRNDEALAELRSAAARHPELFWATLAMAEILCQRRDLQDAMTCFQKALERSPDEELRARILGKMAQTWRDHGQTSAASECYRQAAALPVTLPELHYNWSLLLCETGHVTEAVTQLERAIALRPDFVQAHSTLLGIKTMYLQFQPADLYAEHVCWARRFADPLTARAAPHANDTDPERILNIGYVSGDFREHSVSYFFEPVLARHDRKQFRIYCYDNWPGSDHVNTRLRRLADQWRKIDGMSDEDADALIRTDGIDILVDLSGHTAFNRLMLFARKPAPLQASWLGYMCTTGMAAIDYRLTDAHLDPPGETEHCNREQLLRLHSAATFAPDPDSPPVAPLPALQNGYITFGSFNNYSKIGEPVVQAWARVLQRLPDARLLLIAQNGEDAEEKRQITARFFRHGVAGHRLDIRGRRPMREFLRLVATTDITLDPFPCTGGTTTLHTLWMGVPTVTLAGASNLARGTAGMLSSAGLARLVTENETDYVEALVNLAQDPAALAGVRSGLREQLSKGFIFDSATVTLSLEQAFRAIWRHYSEKKCRAAAGASN